MMKGVPTKLFVVASIFLATTVLAQQSGSQRLERTNLLAFRNPSGEVVPVKTTSDWNKRRADILESMQSIMGPLPGREKRCALDVQVQERVDRGSYERQLISYASEPNSRVTAYLLIPKSAQTKGAKVPSVLALHPTDMSMGHGVVVGLSDKPNRSYASELAERGYVVLAPSYPLMASYQPNLKALGYQSGTMKAIWDNIRGIDLLESLPYVKKDNTGVIGHSLGGHNSIYTAVFDQRIKAIVSSCGFDSYVEYMNGNIKGWTQERYMPRLAGYATDLKSIPFDFYELAGALAPRPFFINAPIGDANFKWKSVDAIVAAAKPVYALHKAESNIVVKHPECAHDFPDEIRNAAYKFLDENLK